MSYTAKDVIAGIVTYNPEISRLTSNIHAVIEQVDNIVIVDNGSVNIEEIEVIIPECIHLIKWDTNKGIAAALRSIMDYAISKGYSWVLTLDQDSIVQANLVDEYLRYANSKTCDNAALFTCLIKDRNFQDKKHELQKKDIDKVDSCITSGAFCSVERYQGIEGYDVGFFIDCVDFDICYQFRDAGYDIYRIKYTGLLHEVGHGENRKFLFWTVVVYHHNANRIYTLARNGVYLWKKHPKIYGINRMIKKHLALITRIVFYEDDKGAKLRAFVQGTKAGVFNR